jgi:zinc protease
LLEKLLEDGVSERELSFAKSYLARSYAFEVDTAAKRLGQRIDEAILLLPKGYHDRYVERVMAVTRDQANAALRKRLSSRNLLITIVATASDVRQSLEDAIAGLRETQVVSFESDPVYSVAVD